MTIRTWHTIESFGNWHVKYTLMGERGAIGVDFTGKRRSARVPAKVQAFIKDIREGNLSVWHVPPSYVCALTGARAFVVQFG